MLKKSEVYKGLYVAICLLRLPLLCILLVVVNQFHTALGQLSASVANVTPSTAEIPDVTSHSEVMVKYRGRLSEIEGLLSLYVALLHKDLNSFHSTGQSLITSDATLGRRIESQNHP